MSPRSSRIRIETQRNSASVQEGYARFELPVEQTVPSHRAQTQYPRDQTHEEQRQAQQSPVAFARRRRKTPVESPRSRAQTDREERQTADRSQQSQSPPGDEKTESERRQ